MQAAIAGHAEPRGDRGRGRGPDRRERRRSPGSSRPTAADPRRRRGAHHRHVPARPDPPSARRRLPAGRHGEPPANGLSRAPAGARACGSAGSRPARRPRLDGRTIDWASLEMQPGDDPPVPFSFLTERIANAADRLRHHHDDRGDPRHHPRQPRTARPCTPARSTASGPRYCPSIEDKVVRFAGRDGAPDLPRARGPGRRHGLSQRRLHLAAGGRAGGLPAHDPGAGEGASSGAPAMPSSTTTSTRASSPRRWR